MSNKLPLIAAAGALAIAAAVPATAPAASKCTTHKVSYTAHGKYVSSNPTLTPTTTYSPTWSGTLTINLTSANHHFTHSTDVTIVHKGTKVQYTFAGITNAKVKFSAAVKKQSLKAGDHVALTGTLTVESGKGCTSPNTVLIKHVYVSSKTGK